MQINYDELQNGHICNIDSNWSGYGSAITLCVEDTERRLWVMNSEYVSQVNFCPVCGYKATKSINGS